MFESDIEEEVVQHRRKAAKSKDGEPKKRGSAFPKEIRKWEDMFKALCERNSALLPAKEIKRMKEQTAIVIQSGRIRNSEQEKAKERLYHLLDRRFGGAITRQLRNEILKETGDPIHDAETARDRAFLRSCGAKV